MPPKPEPVKSAQPRVIAAVLKCDGCTGSAVKLTVDYRFAELLSQIMMLSTNGEETIADDEMRHHVLEILTGISVKQWQQAEARVDIESSFSSRFRRAGGKKKGASPATAAAMSSLREAEEGSLPYDDSPDSTRAASPVNSAAAAAPTPKSSEFPVICIGLDQQLHCFCKVHCLLNCQETHLPVKGKLTQIRGQLGKPESASVLIEKLQLTSWPSLMSAEHLSAIHVDIFRELARLSPRAMSPRGRFPLFPVGNFHFAPINGAASAGSVLMSPMGSEIGEGGKPRTLADSLLDGMMGTDQMAVVISSTRNLYSTLTDDDIKAMLRMQGGQEEALTTRLQAKVPPEQIYPLVELCRHYGRHFPAAEYPSVETIPIPQATHARAAPRLPASGSRSESPVGGLDEEVAALTNPQALGAPPHLQTLAGSPRVSSVASGRSSLDENTRGFSSTPAQSPVPVQQPAPVMRSPITPPRGTSTPIPGLGESPALAPAPPRVATPASRYHTPVDFTGMQMQEYTPFRPPSPVNIGRGSFYRPIGLDGVRYWEWGRIFLTLLITALLATLIWAFLAWYRKASGMLAPTYAPCAEPLHFNVTRATNDCAELPGEIFSVSCRQLEQYINMLQFYQNRGVRQGMNISVGDVDSALETCRGTWNWGATAMQNLRDCFPSGTEIGNYLWSVMPGREDVYTLLQLIRKEVARRGGN